MCYVILAAAQEHPDAKKTLAMIEKEMTPEQKSESMTLARGLFDRIG